MYPKTFVLICLTFGAALGEVVQMPEFPHDWDLSPVAKVALMTNDRMSSGGYDINVKICRQGGADCCSVAIGETYKGDYQEKKVSRRDCHLTFSNQTRPIIRLESSSSNEFMPKFVDVWTKDGAMYQARFKHHWISYRSDNRPSVVFSMPTRLANNIPMPSIECPAPAQEEASCPKTKLSVMGFAGQHNYICDLPCDYVSSVDPQSTGTGFRCFQTTSLHEKVEYCCEEGPRGDVPGCPGPVSPRMQSNVEQIFTL